MKHASHLLRSLSVVGSFGLAVTVLAQLGINDVGVGVAPHPDAMLDLSSTTKGLLAPRMSAGQRDAIAAPAEGLIVFVTPGSAVNPRGFWYYDADPPINGWTNVFNSDQGWQYGGNAGVGGNVIGTTNNQDFVFRTDGVERMRVRSGIAPADGLVGINTTAPDELLHMDGGLQIIGTTASNNRGTIRFNSTTNAHDGNVDNTANWYQLENVFNLEKDQDYYSDPVPTCGYAVGVNNYPTIDNPLFANNTTLGTIESPYSRFWEDGRHQYLYLASDFANLSICPNEDIIG
ncbi:MAG: hypothetical protein KDB88_01080, partial [Flavobacteriales bacterium]|nr:hypothetical protein [Flavobacteriales bacterium]